MQINLPIELIKTVGIKKFTQFDITEDSLNWKKKVEIDEKEYAKFAENHPDISGRDVKNLLKLASLISSTKKKPITTELLEYVLKFKPTTTEVKK
jgi:hypothetical protein